MVGLGTIGSIAASWVRLRLLQSEPKLIHEVDLVLPSFRVSLWPALRRLFLHSLSAPRYTSKFELVPRRRLSDTSYSRQFAQSRLCDRQSDSCSVLDALQHSREQEES